MKVTVPSWVPRQQVKVLRTVERSLHRRGGASDNDFDGE